MIALLVAAAAVPSAIDAERAFARIAQERGQWTAFRAFADRRAVMFTPQPIAAIDFLRGRDNPPRAVIWSPALSLQSCDGKLAVNHGPWHSAKAHGSFTTIWARRGPWWKWIYDGGKATAAPLDAPQEPAIRIASCRHLPRPRPLPAPGGVARRSAGQSPDASLQWEWAIDAAGARRLRVRLWDGRRFADAFDETIAATE